MDVGCWVFLRDLQGFCFFLPLLNVDNIGLFGVVLCFCGVCMFLEGFIENMLKTREIGFKIMLFRKPTKSSKY